MISSFFKSSNVVAAPCACNALLPPKPVQKMIASAAPRDDFFIFETNSGRTLDDGQPDHSALADAAPGPARIHGISAHVHRIACTRDLDYDAAHARSLPAHGRNTCS